MMEEDISEFRRQYQKEGLNAKTIVLFQNTILNNYKKNRRDLPWRKNKNPYRVLVSEIMLQQTQVPRVIEKYNAWLKKFPGFESLAKAPVSEVIKEWQGLGYNRRGLFLKKAAETVVSQYEGKLPQTEEELVKLPGIGKATAASIIAFAFNKPTVFIETNVRSVYLHFFFHDQKDIDDSKIQEIAEITIDRKKPSDWYNAIMDCGSLLKAQYGNPNKRSRQYQKQSKFEGSNRQLRGMILRLLSTNKKMSLTQLERQINKDKNDIEMNVAQLEKEGFVGRKTNYFFLQK